MFDLSKLKTFGLDIGSHSVKLVQLERRGPGFCALAAACVCIAQAQDESEQRKNILAAIAACLSQSGVKSSAAVGGINGAEALVRNFRFGAMPPEELEQAIRFEAIQFCPFELDQGTIDYKMLSPTAADQGGVAVAETTLRGVMVASANKAIKARRQLILDANLDCILLDADSLALYNCLTELRRPAEGHCLVLVNIGHRATSVVIAPDGGLPFIRELSSGGNDIQASLAEGAEPAEASRKLLGDVNETIRYYKAQEGLAPVEEILICGGYALADNFLELVRSQFHEPAAWWNPFERLDRESRAPGKELMDESGPALAVAAGLAMRCTQE